MGINLADVIARIVPIILLISLGKYLWYKEIFKQNTVDEIKNIVVNVALSAVLFLTFLNMELKVEFFLVFIIIFLLLIIFFLTGFAVNQFKGTFHPLTPFITSGFSFGLLGIPLFTAIFGVENIGNLSILGVGQEFFIWFVFYTVMRVKFKGEKINLGFVKEMIKSPLIISIVFGLLFNILGLENLIRSFPLTMGLYTTLEYLSSLAMPLMLIIVGYGLKFNKKYMRQSTKFVAIRMLIILSLGYLAKILILNNIMETTAIFDYAYFTFLILPPPLSLSIFVGAYSGKEYEELANNTVVLNTVVSIAIFIIFVLMIS